MTEEKRTEYGHRRRVSGAVRINPSEGFAGGPGSSGGRPVLRTVEGKLATPTATASPKKVKFIYRKHGSYLLTINKMQSCESIA